MEPILNPEIAGHFCHSCAHGFLVASQTFQSESQLMPDLIGNDLIIRILHYKPNLGGLFTLAVLPMKYENADGAPVRAAAIMEE